VNVVKIADAMHAKYGDLRRGTRLGSYTSYNEPSATFSANVEAVGTNFDPPFTDKGNYLEERVKIDYVDDNKFVIKNVHYRLLLNRAHAENFRFQEWQRIVIVNKKTAEKVDQVLLLP